MPLETRPSARAEDPTINQVQLSLQGILTCRRKSVPVAGTTVTIPAKIKAGRFKNAGSNDIKFNFFSDSASNHWTLEPGDEIELPLLDKVVMNIRSIGSPSTLECIFWG